MSVRNGCGFLLAILTLLGFSHEGLSLRQQRKVKVLASPLPLLLPLSLPLSLSLPLQPMPAILQSLSTTVSLGDDLDFDASSFESQHFKMTKDNRPKRSFGSHLDYAPVLVLNADYQPLSHEPLSLWSWQDAIRAILTQKAGEIIWL